MDFVQLRNDWEWGELITASTEGFPEHLNADGIGKTILTQVGLPETFFEVDFTGLRSRIPSIESFSSSATVCGIPMQRYWVLGVVAENNNTPICIDSTNGNIYVVCLNPREGLYTYQFVNVSVYTLWQFLRELFFATDGLINEEPEKETIISMQLRFKKIDEAAMNTHHSFWSTNLFYYFGFSL